MDVINKYVVLKKEGKVTLAGCPNNTASFNSTYEVLFEGSLEELENSEYSNLLEA